MTWLLADFSQTEPVTGALRDLKAAGFTPADIDLFSEEPIELPRGVLDRPTQMSFRAVVSAIVFGSLATGFVYFAQNNYRIRSGGMPYFSLWGSGVISYEMTMFGSILAIFGSFLWESRLFRRPDPKAPKAKCPPNGVCLRLRCAERNAEQISETLRSHGARVHLCDC